MIIEDERPKPENVIPIRPEIEIPLTETKKPACRFACRRVACDSKRRMLVCQDCETSIDAYDWLLQWAREGDNRLAWLKDLNAKVTSKRQELEKLNDLVKQSRQKARKAGVPSPKIQELKFYGDNPSLTA